MATTETIFPTDPLSCANTKDYRLSHLVWEADFDFSSKIISATAELHFNICSSGVPSPLLILDIHNIQVIEVCDCVSNRKLKWEIGASSVLGTSLSITLFSDMIVGKDELKINIEYKVTNATAVQWLAPEQTKGMFM
ncbi:hypothetical protein LOD99_452 [Oopsacas minuta]|uniref:Uncharacterized protein n=1 Tax=Oopsacas minuta TaxID=111878 RepID=A0AAV7K8Y8_9METZ|nr:hypothetical protein LOD99_452 [Oopsacas minuta]